MPLLLSTIIVSGFRHELVSHRIAGKPIVFGSYDCSYLQRVGAKARCVKNITVSEAPISPVIVRVTWRSGTRLEPDFTKMAAISHQAGTTAWPDAMLSASA